MMQDTWAQEKRVVAIFIDTVDKVGFWRADLAWSEAGLHDDDTADDKVQRAVEVARKLGVTLGGEGV